MTPDPRDYTLYGLCICSEIPLPVPLSPNGHPADLSITLGAQRAIPAAAPGVPLLAKLEVGKGRGYALFANEGGYTLRFYGTAAHIAPNLAHVRLHLAPATDLDLAALLIIGNVLACVLTLSGEAVLHASAIEINGCALAFLGNSGMGKSRLAALLCAHGAHLITDDLLRLQENDNGWCCFPGIGQLRIRKSAAVLVENIPAAQLGTTADDRIAVEMGGPVAMPVLGAIVIPQVSRECTTLHVERIPAAKALLYLMAYARIQETPQKERRQRRLNFLGRVAASVPIFAVTIPWGLPYPAGLADALLESVFGFGGEGQVP